jgi:hypothetical protein
MLLETLTRANEPASFVNVPNPEMNRVGSGRKGSLLLGVGQGAEATAAELPLIFVRSHKTVTGPTGRDGQGERKPAAAWPPAFAVASVQNRDQEKLGTSRSRSRSR